MQLLHMLCVQNGVSLGWGGVGWGGMVMFTWTCKLADATHWYAAIISCQLWRALNALIDSRIYRSQISLKIQRSQSKGRNGNMLGRRGGCPNFIVFCTHSCRPLSSLASCLVGGAVTSSCAFSCSMHSYRPLSSLASCLVRGAITSSCAFSWASLYNFIYTCAKDQQEKGVRKSTCRLETRGWQTVFLWDKLPWWAVAKWQKVTRQSWRSNCAEQQVVWLTSWFRTHRWLIRFVHSWKP